MIHQFPREMFETAEDIIVGKQHRDSEHVEAARCFLTDLGYLDKRGAVSDFRSPDFMGRMLGVARRFQLFAVPVPDADRALFIGGQVHPGEFSGLAAYPSSSISGISLSLAIAFESCLGEGIEYLSQLEHGDENIKTQGQLPTTPSEMEWLFLNWQNFQHEDLQDQHTLDWILGTSLLTGNETLIPAEFCLRRAKRSTQYTLSNGCAVADTHLQAMLSALLEVIERDAAALWWIGGKSPRPISAEALFDADIQALFQNMSRNSSQRRTLFLDITTDIGIPTVAAISANVDDGQGFACGLAARLTLPQAIHKAALELVQMELGHHVIAAKLKHRPDHALNTHDDNHLQRARLLGGIWQTPLVQPDGYPQEHSIGELDADKALTLVKNRFLELELDAFAVDITRKHIGLPAVKILVPELQPCERAITTVRLQKVLERTGGGDQYTLEIPLLQ